ncbi:carbonic anhydrase 7-like [Ylistrum balloti]|uniref:carbonic anhydrase 7-like n=1 Tax=Ylistrum balloti TaxID=509963 RepID=UPI002905F601|nr:carbonic anhydrase 7-like [Ylistrum balloti]
MNVLVKLVFIFLLQLQVSNSSTVERTDNEVMHAHVEEMFSYDSNSRTGPTKWLKFWPACGGKTQSPVNINNSMVQADKRYHIQFSDEFREMTGDLVNNGHAPTFYFDHKSRLLFGAPGLPNEVFVLDQLHFHFGDRFETGSEHAIDGIKFPVEVHLAHYNRKYGNLNNATSKSDGVVVLGVFMQVGMGRPGALDKFIENYLSDIRIPDMKGVRATLNPSILLPYNRSFYTYVGSLTTPPCSERVRWILMRTHKSISLRAYNLLRSLRDNYGDRIARYGNCRPIQKLGCRIVEST